MPGIISSKLIPKAFVNGFSPFMNSLSLITLEKPLGNFGEDSNVLNI